MGKRRKRYRGRARRFIPNASSRRRNRTRSRSQSPRLSRSPTRLARSRTGSPMRIRSRSRTRSPRRIRNRSRTRSPRRIRSRSRTRSPRRIRSRSRTRSPRRIKSHSRSQSPRRIRSRSTTRSPRRIRSRSRSQSPRRIRSRSRTRSPRRIRSRSRSQSPRHSRTPIRRARSRTRSRSRSQSPRWRRSFSRSRSPWQHRTAFRRRPDASRRLSRSRSCPLLCCNEKLYEPHMKDSSCRFNSSERFGKRYGSLSPNRFQMMNHSPMYPQSASSFFAIASRSRSVSRCDSPGVLSSRSVSRSCSRSRSRESLGNIRRTTRKTRHRRRYRRSWSRSRSRSYSRSRSRSYSQSRSRSYSRSRSRSGLYSRSRSRSRSPCTRRNAKRTRRRRRRRGSSNRSPNTSKMNPIVVDIDQNASEFFFADASIDEHIKAQNQNRSRYIACMALLHSKGVEIRQKVRVCALAASWARNDFKMSTEFLRDRDRYGIVEILKALQMLDSGRLIQQGEKKLKRLQTARGKVSRHKMNKLKCKINSLRKLQPEKGSASGPICKYVRKWTKTLSKEELERYAIHFPKKPWRKLADICHFNPVEDFPNLPWFLSYCFGTSAPDGTVVHACEDLNKRNINDKLKTCAIPYAHCRQFKRYLNVESKIKIASSEPRLDTVLWYYEDLECRQVDEIIMQRLDTGDQSHLPIGKLMDLLVTLKELARGFRCGRRMRGKYKIPFMKTLLSLAESKLQNVTLKLDSPVVVLGDRSASMNVAVRTSSVIAGILCSICSADLVVFNDRCDRPKKVPASVDEALQLAMKTRADCSTNPSSALMPFYKHKTIVKTFIVVTDEGENIGNFADLFEKYHNEVFPARLVFVSFLRQHEKGEMCTELKEKGFNPLQFVLNARKPDLTKLEKLLGILALENKSFNEELSILQSEITRRIHGGGL